MKSAAGIAVLLVPVLIVAAVIFAMRSESPNVAVVVEKLDGPPPSLIVEHGSGRLSMPCHPRTWESVHTGDRIELVIIRLRSGVTVKRPAMDLEHITIDPY
jgi:hypothetical protein